MAVKIVGVLPEKVLEDRIRGVPLKDRDPTKEKKFPYKDATIMLREMLPAELNPGSLYILQEQLERQRELRDKLRRVGLDLFHLKGGYVIEVDGGPPMTLIPPIIEVTHEHMGYVETRGDIPHPEPTEVRMNVIVDGLHRLYLAHLVEERTCGVIHISGVPQEYPFYALPNRWDEVKIHQAPPKPKKYYRNQDSYGLYRDFEILGCGAPRVVETPPLPPKP